MDSKFAPEVLIPTCLNRVFERNSIRHLRCRSDWAIGSEESIVEIRGKNLTVTHAHPSQSQIRFNFFINLTRNALEKFNLDLNCRFILSTHDTVSKNEKYTRLCFSAAYDSNHIQIPDPHVFHHSSALANELANDIPFEKKIDKVIFVGSDTGAINDKLLNQRIQFCDKAFGNPNVFAKISNFVSFNKEMLDDLGISEQKIKIPYLSVGDQLNYKFILNIDGNASSWDRTPWAMSSNSYLIHLKSTLCDQVNWYHHFIQENGILPVLSEEDVLNYKVKYNEKIKAKQKAFAAMILDPKIQFEYFASVLSAYNNIYNAL